MCDNIQSADEEASHQTNRLDRSDGEQFEQDMLKEALVAQP